MNGGHRLTVWLGSPSDGLKAFCGIALNQSGRPSTAGIGRGSTDSSSGGQLKMMVLLSAWSTIAVLTDPDADCQFFVESKKAAPVARMEPLRTFTASGREDGR